MNENYVRIGGGLTKDPHYQTTRHDSQMVGMTIAVNGARYDSQQKQQVVTTEFISVVAFGTVAEMIVEMGLSRGDSIVVEGALSQQVVENEQGEKDRKTRVQAWSVRPVRVRGARTHSAPPPTTPDQGGWSTQPTGGQQGGNWGGGPPAYDEPPF